MVKMLVIWKNSLTSNMVIEKICVEKFFGVKVAFKWQQDHGINIKLE